MKFNKEINFFEKTSDGGIFLDSPILQRAHDVVIIIHLSWVYAQTKFSKLNVVPHNN